ncbi:MAG TPA: ABC transporter permease [Syntrophomonas sp.]|nr:ABC transporter permease [Syntrophomonas sp.]
MQKDSFVAFDTAVSQSLPEAVSQTQSDLITAAGNWAGKGLHAILEYLKKILGIIAFFVFWEVASRTGLIDSVFIPPFSRVVTAFYGLLASGELAYHASASLMRALAGLGLAIVVALPLGLMIGQIRVVERFLDPLLQMFRQTSTLALLPVFILLLGLGETSKIMMIFWGVQWPILLNTISGAKNIDPVLLKSARSIGTPKIKLLWKIVIPGALPSIFTGVRLGATSAVLLLIAAEMVGASVGLGFAVFDFEVKYKIPEMFAVILSFTILGLALNYLLVFLERKIIKWKQE